METWMIAASAVGGCVFVAFLALLIYKCCQRRKRKINKRFSKAQNGYVWQVHEKDVELGDEDDPQKRLKEDGLCKDTKAGSTFPRRIKEDANPQAKREDGLCQDTQKRFTYPRRVKPENELLLPVEKKNLSASEAALKSAFPVGVSVITSSGGTERNVKNEEPISFDGADVQVHSIDHITPKKQAKDGESSSDSSSDSDNEKRGNGTDHLLSSSAKRRRKTKRSRSVVSESKLADSSNISLEDIPEYSKAIKRSKSNPSLVARQKMIQKDKRFESLETWRSSVPLPAPDYSNAMVISKSRVVEDDDQDNAPPSYATSDSGVECLDALSGNDDESINHCDSVPESPGIPSSQLTLRDESSFSSYKEYASIETRYDETKYDETKYIRHTSNHGINGFQGNIVARTTKDHTAIIDANVDKDFPSPSAANQQDIFLQSTPDFRTRNVDLPKDDPNVAPRSTSVGEKITPASNSPSNTKDTSERIQKAQAQMDFRNVKLKPTSTNYVKDDSFTIFGSNQGSTVVVSSDKEDKVEVTSVVQKFTTKTETVTSSSQPTIISVTDGFQKQNVITETNATQRNSPETEKRTDFHGVKLRQTSQNLKQSIAFREDMEPCIAEKQTPNREKHATYSTIVNETESTIGVLDGIRKFQTQGAQVPKPLFGSHYISQKDPHLKPVNIVSREPVANLKPVNIVPAEPGSIDREMHKTITISSNPSNKANEGNVIQNNNTSTITTTNVTRRPASMHESVTREEKLHFRYSMGNVNQGHDVTQHSNASQKTVVVIKGQDGFEKTTTREQDSLDKPVAIVTPQSPKMKRETPEEIAALEEERKKQWKREQIEQKLTTAHVRNQNQQFIQASGLAYKSCMPELFSKIKQIGEEKEQGSTQQ